MNPERRRYTVAVDFDGVLHSYTTPWVAPHVIPDPPVPGAIEWLLNVSQRLDVVIFTTRGRTWRGRRAVRRWLREWGGPFMPVFKVTDRKVPALAYLDDRALRFDGKKYPSAGTIFNARPWNKPRQEEP